MQLLAQIGIEPDRLLPGDRRGAEEERAAPHFAKRLSREKAEAAIKALQGEPELEGALILAADTVVGLGRRCLPKAELIEEAATCLRLLSGRSHRVYTGLAMVTPRDTYASA